MHVPLMVVLIRPWLFAVYSACGYACMLLVLAICELLIVTG